MSESEIFGNLYAALYDVMYRDKDYVRECDTIEKLLNGAGRAEQILDLGCGTGLHARELAARDHHVTGVDRSAHMIERARSRNLPNCQFVAADIRGLELGRTFDAVILMFNVVGYALDDCEFDEIFATARRHLATGGKVIFDFWHAPGIRACPPRRSVRDGVLDGRRWSRKSSGVLLEERNSVDISCTLQWSGDSAAERHEVRYFECREITSLLCRAGFSKAGFGRILASTRAPAISDWSALGWATSD